MRLILSSYLVEIVNEYEAASHPLRGSNYQIAIACQCTFEIFFFCSFYCFTTGCGGLIRRFSPSLETDDLHAESCSCALIATVSLSNPPFNLTIYGGELKSFQLCGRGTQ